MKLLEIILLLFLLGNDEKPEEFIRLQEEERAKQQRVQECVVDVMEWTQDTPLRGFEYKICKESEETGIDWRLVLSIGIVESGLCKNTNFRYNCWSISVHNRKYNGYSDSIEDIFRLLVRYRERGLETPEQISKRYCPPTSEKWAKDVTYLINQMKGENK